MAKEMLINVSEGEECRIALIEDGKLEELYMERASSALHVGNIYKGKVTNVEPSIQAAFVDFGLGRNGFLHISDLMPTYFGQGGPEIHETVGRKLARRDRPPIQRCLRRGDEIVVQIIKEGIGTKGPTLSTYLSIPGQILVMMPGMGKMGVSKKIEDEEERRRLRQILDGLKPPKDCGFIIRTSGVGRTKAEIERDLKYLSRLWETLKKKEASGPGAMELYTEGDLVTRTVRDLFTSDIERIVVDNKEVAKRVKEVIKITMPRTKNRVELYEDPIPLFHKFGIERELEMMYSRHVPLPSGGSLVIDSTEAIVAIDVNSGKNRDHNDAEMTAFRTDMEAADEIPRQLKLRDLGGVIICDFIDLRFERNRRELEQRLHDNFKNDRAKTKVLRMSQFGIIELTRQRMRPSLKRSIYFDCPHCKGAGLVKTPESMSLDVMRRVALAAHDLKVARVEVSVHPDVAFYLQNKKRAALAELEDEAKKRIDVRADGKLALDEVQWQLFDAREGAVFLESIGMLLPATGHGNQSGAQREGRGGGRNDRRDRRDKRSQPPQPGRREQPRDEEEDRFDLDADESGEERPEQPAQPDEATIQQNTRSGGRDNRRPPRGGRGPQRDSRGTNPKLAQTPPEIPVEPEVEIEDGHAELGPAPEGMDDDHRGGGDRNRNQRRGGRGGRDRDRQGGRQQNQPVGTRHQRGPQNRNQDQRNPRDQHDEVGDADGNRATSVGGQDEPIREPMKASPPAIVDQPFAAGDIDAPAMEDGSDPSQSSIEPRDGQVGPVELGEDGLPRKRRRRRRRGGRRHRRRGAGGQANAGEQAEGFSNQVIGSDTDDFQLGESETNTETTVSDVQIPQTKPPVPPRREDRQPRRLPPTPIPQPPVVRTGSTDKHLVSDIPVEPQPISRPKSYRDLDAIPDDFD